MWEGTRSQLQTDLGLPENHMVGIGGLATLNIVQNERSGKF